MAFSIVSWLDKLKNNKIFEMTVVAVIIISALEIGAKTFPLSDGAVDFTKILQITIKKPFSRKAGIFLTPWSSQSV